MKKSKRWLCLALLPLLALMAARQEETPHAYIALTFDDSPNAALTERLLDGLASRGAHATFFLIGEQLEGQENLVRRMADEGHQLGNHTYTHLRLDTTGAVGLQEVKKTDARLKEIAGERTYWVRPPWGFASEETLREISAPLIYWSVDSEDWSLRDAGKIARRVTAAAGDGDIVLLHDSYPESVDAALRIVDTLQARGFTFVTVEELFAHMNIEAEAGKLYARPDTLRPPK